MEADVVEGCRAIGFTLGVPALVDGRRRRRRAGRPRVRRAAPELGGRAGHAAPTSRATRRASRRTTSPTPWPPRRWPAHTACGPWRSGTGCGRSVPTRTASPRSRPSTASGSSTTPRPPTRTRPRRRCGRSTRSCGSPAACSRAPTSTQPRRAVAVRAGCAASSSSAPTGSGSPRRWPDTRPTSRSSTCRRHGHWCHGRRRRRGPPRWPQPGDVVLLAPAAASMDMFANYGARGDAFEEAVPPLGPRARLVSEHATRPPARPRPGRVDATSARRGPGAGCCTGAAVSRGSSRRVTTYYVLLGATVMLVVIGLIMVLSASIVDVARATDDATSYASSSSQLPVRRDRRRRRGRRRPRPGAVVEAAGRADPGRRARCCSCWSSPRSASSVNGNRNWLALGPVQLQPVGVRQDRARARRRRGPRRQAQAARPDAARRRPVPRPGRRRDVGLVLLGHDLGTVMVMVGDRRRRCCSPPGCRAACSSRAALLRRRSRSAMVVTSRNRMGRFTCWLGNGTNPTAPAASRARPLRPGRRRLVGRRSRRQPGEVAAGCPRPTTTSSSPSSARSSACPGRSYPRAVRAARVGLLPARAAPTTTSSGSRRPASWCGSSVQAIINIGAVIGQQYTNWNQ